MKREKISNFPQLVHVITFDAAGGLILLIPYLNMEELSCDVDFSIFYITSFN